MHLRREGLGILADHLQRENNTKFALESSLGATGEEGSEHGNSETYSPFQNKTHTGSTKSGSDPERQLQHLKATKKGNGFSQLLKTSAHTLLHLPAATPGPICRGGVGKDLVSNNPGI